MTPFQLSILYVFERGEEIVVNWQGKKIRKNVGVTYFKLLYLNLRGEKEEIPTKLGIVGKDNREFVKAINFPAN
jgi:hypothetical protein